ncbi:MAG: hypothetical protein AAFR18_11795 [Cyanobacteria bacterium J06627_32]
MESTRHDYAERVESQSRFVQVIEDYLNESDWTKKQMMAAINIGETQLYRWARGESVPSKGVVNRIAVTLARRLDEIQRQRTPGDLYSATDRIDGIVNELLTAAGYSASIKGVGANLGWEEIAKSRQWKIGYLDIPNLLETPSASISTQPTGTISDYVEQVGRLLGLSTNWQRFLGWNELNVAILERKIHGIAPFMLTLPERSFYYRFSEPVDDQPFGITAVVSPQHAELAEELEDLTPRRTELIYVKDEIGAWAASVLGSSYKRKAFQSTDEAIAYLTASAPSSTSDFHSRKVLPAFLSENITCSRVAQENAMKLLPIHTFKNVRLFSAFAFHIDEEKLVSTVNPVINMLPQKILSNREGAGEE